MGVQCRGVRCVDEDLFCVEGCPSDTTCYGVFYLCPGRDLSDSALFEEVFYVCLCFGLVPKRDLHFIGSCLSGLLRAQSSRPLQTRAATAKFSTLQTLRHVANKTTNERGRS